MSDAAAKQALIDFYIDKQSIFDKAVSALGKGASFVAVATANTTISALKAARRKIRKGF